MRLRDLFVAQILLVAFALPARADLPVPTNMVRITESSFEMGHPADTLGPYGDPWFVDQTPEHTVYLGQYYMDKYEVSVANFALFLTNATDAAPYFHAQQPIEQSADGYVPVSGMDDEPMRQVTWAAANAYCAWRNKTLPTEAQWERAAAGADDGWGYPWQESGGATCANINHFTGRVFCAEGPIDVGSYEDGKTPDAIYDLAGNVAEWVSDWYGDYSSDTQYDPTGPASGDYKVTRGGSYADGPYWVRTYARVAVPADKAADTIGFRCAWDDTMDTPPDLSGFTSASAAGGGHPWPYAPAALASNLPVRHALSTTSIGSLVALGEQIYFADTLNGNVVAYDPVAQSEAVVLGDLNRIGQLASDGVDLFFVGDDADDIGQVWRFTPGGAVSTLATEQTGVVHVVAGDGEVFWADADSMTHYDLSTETSQPYWDGLNDIKGLSLDTDYLLVAAALSASDWRIYSDDRASNTLTELFNANTLGNLGDVVLPYGLGHADGKIYVTLRYINWPSSGFVYRYDLSTSAKKKIVHSAPGIGPLTLWGEHIYWGSWTTLSRLHQDESGSYVNIGSWTEPSGMTSTSDTLYWGDAKAGVLYAWQEEE
ncbi:MAG: SUMF1/EgtB/PvdO family nonheme iron enzyme [Myxococcota bacterium]|nr:SUMF1/EgtB/PvdO family nonheme iron enzyme [Myxococcota bacterium]